MAGEKKEKQRRRKIYGCETKGTSSEGAATEADTPRRIFSPPAYYRDARCCLPFAHTHTHTGAFNLLGMLSSFFLLVEEQGGESVEVESGVEETLKPEKEQREQKGGDPHHPYVGTLTFEEGTVLPPPSSLLPENPIVPSPSPSPPSATSQHQAPAKQGPAVATIVTIVALGFTLGLAFYLGGQPGMR